MGLDLGLATSAIGLAFVLGVVFWGGFNTVLEWIHTEAFCILCHEMRDNLYVEYRGAPKAHPADTGPAPAPPPSASAAAIK